MSDFLKFALEYEKMGLSVIPVVSGKKVPQIDWKEFQTRRATPQEIVSWWSKWPEANVGIVTGLISDLCVVDLDRYKEGFTQENELLHFPETLVTPTSNTPRGGTHLWFRNVAGVSGSVDIYPGIDFRGEGNFAVAPPSKNGSGNPYSWGISLGDAPPQMVPESFLAILKERYSYLYNKINYNTRCDKNNPLQDVTSVTSSDSFYVEGRRDNDLFHLANVLVKSKCDLGFIVQTLKMLAKTCNPPYPDNEIDIKIQSALDRTGRREGKLVDEAREIVLATNGDFSVTECDRNLNLVTTRDKNNLRQILHRFCKDEKIIEKVGSKNGIYRLIDQDSPVIEVYKADTTPYDIKFPLGVHELVYVHKSNIVILAGDSNAGKSAYCLATARLNMNHLKVNYLSSEMQDGTELKIRLEAFGEPLESWKKVDFRFRTDNFADIIKPNDLNIVDYLDEGSEEPYKMASRIKAIGRKLDKGIVIICIQKNSQKQYGFGGEATKNAARLYMTITGQNKLTIEKGKIWKSQLNNPNGQFCEFKLVAGCKFTAIKDMEGRSWKMR